MMAEDTLATLDRDALLAALAWQVELGVDECVGDATVDRFAAAAEPIAAPTPRIAATPTQAPQTAPAASPPASAQGAGPEDAEALTEARRLALAAETLEDLHAAMSGFDGCALQRGAKSTVFSDGSPAARVMFIGEAPGREEDREGKPFIGRSGQLLDRMLAAIGLDRRTDDPATAAYITNVTPWRPLGDRDPSTDEALMMWAFLERHIELAAPEVIVTLGKISSGTLLEAPVRITRERGRWVKPPRAGGRPMLMSFHPAYLLRQPAEKAKSWRDLLSLRAVLDGAPPQIED